MTWRAITCVALGGGAPVPQIGFGAATASLEPAVLYSHSITMERRQPGVNSN